MREREKGRKETIGVQRERNQEQRRVVSKPERRERGGKRSTKEQRRGKKAQGKEGTKRKREAKAHLEAEANGFLFGQCLNIRTVEVEAVHVSAARGTASV